MLGIGISFRSIAEGKNQVSSISLNFAVLFLMLVALSGISAEDKKMILFVCEHGSAKSVVAAAHFNHLAQQQGLPFQAVSRGTTPDPEIAAAAAKGLTQDGIPVPSEKPAKLTSSDAEQASRIITFCDLPEDIKADNVERWTVPPISEDYPKSRTAIIQKLNALIKELKE